MNYLFFDIECAKCAKNGVGYICEFGYFVVNDNFEKIDQGHFLINPKCQFGWYELKKILRYSKEEYLKQPTFDKYYDTIQEILTRKGQVVVGHSTKGDYTYLASQCIRYKKDVIDFKYYDIRKPFMTLQKEETFTSLKGMITKLNVQKQEAFHAADSDAFYTMLVCKELCQKYNLTLPELLSLDDGEY